MAKTMGRQGLLFHIIDVVFNIVVIVAVVAGIRTFLVSPFEVEGSSMSSTLENREYIVINKLAYFIGAPHRGDIVVFRPPNEPDKYYVKRVIGLPNDTVTIRDGNVFVKEAGSDVETKLDEPYLDERNRGKTFRHPPTSGDVSPIIYKVPDGQYFLLGDNRQSSLDSRSFTVNDVPHPFVAQNDIKGRFWFVALPFTKIHAFSPPAYDLAEAVK